MGAKKKMGEGGRSHSGLENERNTCSYIEKYIFKFYLLLNSYYHDMFSTYPNVNLQFKQ